MPPAALKRERRRRLAALSHPAGSMMLDKSFNFMVPISIDYRSTIRDYHIITNIDSYNPSKSIH
jgi:hypothetical protein